MTTLYFITFLGNSFAQPESTDQAQGQHENASPISLTSLLEKEEGQKEGQKEDQKEGKKQENSGKKKSKIPTAGIYFEGGALETMDSVSDDLFGYQQTMSGIRVTRDLDKNISLLASWNMGGTRSDSSYYGYYDYDYDYGYYEEDVYYGNSNVDTLVTINQLMTGVRYSYRLTSWLLPYASAQALVQHGHLVITDDYDSERRLFEFTSQSLSVGGAGTLGVELRSGKIAKKYKLSLYGETGYSKLSPLNFKYDSGVDDAEKLSLGQIQLGGVYSRFGIGLKF